MAAVGFRKLKEEEVLARFGPRALYRQTTSLSFDDLFGRVPKSSIPTNTCLGPDPDQTLIKSFLEEILHNESENHVYALLELYKFDKKKIYIYIYITNVFILFSKENIWLGGYQ